MRMDDPLVIYDKPYGESYNTEENEDMKTAQRNQNADISSQYLY